MRLHGEKLSVLEWHLQYSGASNNIRGVYTGGYNGAPTGNRINTIQAFNIPTDGDIFDFGDLTYTAQQMSGAGNQTEWYLYKWICLSTCTIIRFIRHDL